MQKNLSENYNAYYNSKEFPVNNIKNETGKLYIKIFTYINETGDQFTDPFCYYDKFELIKETVYRGNFFSFSIIKINLLNVLLLIN